MAQPVATSPPATGGPRHFGRAARGGRGDRVSWLLVPGLIVACALFVLPLGRMVIMSLETGTGVGLENYQDLVAPGSLFGTILLRTVLISGIVALLALVIGYPLAYAAVRLPDALAVALLVAVALPFFTAALVRTYAWQVLLADNGPINSLLMRTGLVDSPVRLLYSDLGVIIGSTQVMLPLMILPLYSAMRRIDRSVPLAAQSLGASPFRAWRTVFFPLTRVGIASGLALVFLTTMGFYITPVMLQGPSTPMLAQSISNLIEAPGRQGAVAAQSVVVLGLAVIVMVAFRRHLGLTLDIGAKPERWLKNRRLPRPAGPRMSGEHPVLRAIGRGWRTFVGTVDQGVSRARFPVLVVAVTFGLLVLLLPLVVVVMLAFSGSNFLEFPPPSFSTRWFSAYLMDEEWIESTRLSITVGLVAAVAATVVGGLAAFSVVRSKARHLPTFSYLLLVAPMVVPETILAAALFYTLSPADITGSPLALVLAYTLLGLPGALIIMTAIFRNLDPAYERAAASLGASPPRVASSVIAPIIRPALITVMLFAFFKGFDDLVMAQFLGGHSAITLVRRMFQDIMFEISPQVASVGVLLIGIVGLVSVLVLMARRRVSLRHTEHQP